MIKHQGLPHSLVKPGKDASMAENLVITDLDNTSLYICSEEDVIIMTQAANVFVKNDHKTALFHANISYIQARFLLPELLVHHLRQEKEPFLTFSLLPDTKIGKTKIKSDSILSLFICIMRHFEYIARENRRSERQRQGCAKGYFFVESWASFPSGGELFFLLSCSVRKFVGINSVKRACWIRETMPLREWSNVTILAI